MDCMRPIVSASWRRACSNGGVPSLTSQKVNLLDKRNRWTKSPSGTFVVGREVQSLWAVSVSCPSCSSSMTVDSIADTFETRSADDTARGTLRPKSNGSWLNMCLPVVGDTSDMNDRTFTK